MKNKAKKRRLCPAVSFCIVALLAVVAAIFSRFGGFGTGKCADVQEFSKYASELTTLEIPASTQLVALGEASHGNAEFQRLKLDLFKLLVERYGVRAFALEGDYGGCEVVNRYILGGNGTAEQAAAAIGFAIYRTQEMEALITWMRSYNDAASPEDQLRFYGFDMQRCEHSFRYLLEAARHYNVDSSRLELLWDEEACRYSSAYTDSQREEIIRAVRNHLPASDAQVLHFADVLLQNLELGKHADDNSTYPVLRDRMMAQNTLWILQQEQARGNQTLFLSGHNGHVQQHGSYGASGKGMGELLADELGDAYFAIGTDFYRTRCNLPKDGTGKRLYHSFYSHDPMAKAAKKCGFSEAYLDFSRISPDSPLYAQAMAPMWMGSLGEYYSALFMNLFPTSYRISSAPAVLYDAMIFVTFPRPTEIKDLLPQASYELDYTWRTHPTETDAAPIGNEINPQGDDWVEALSESILQKYGVLMEKYELLENGQYRIYAEIGGEILPFGIFDSLTGELFL